MFSKEEIKAAALSVGIDACGVVQAAFLAEDADYLRDWLRKGYHGSMAYMAAHQAERLDPRQLVPNGKTVVVCLVNYYKVFTRTAEQPVIAMSGMGQSDYHIVVKSLMQQLEERLLAISPDCIDRTRQHIFCDSAPILERRWAQKAGLGWLGKNHLLIHPTLGSFTNIGILVLQDECIDYDTPLANQCGECTACLHACPTGAFRESFDARKCISYLTIERKEPLTPAQQKMLVANKALYGCDRCQEACPYNKHLTPTKHQALQLNSTLAAMNQEDWNCISRRQKVKLLNRLAKDI